MKKIKLKKLLNKNITIQESACIGLGLVFVILGIICLIKTPFKKYSYVDLDNNFGESYKCYKYKGKLVCEVRKEVKQYYTK